MARTIPASCEQYNDEALIHRYFELSEHAGEHADELAAIDATIQSRLFSTYGAAAPGSLPRTRIVA